MSIIGYSDPINHALAFAAKHHDQQVRKGVRAPYLMQPANIAIILSRYGQDEVTMIAGILYDVVDDAVSDRYRRETLEQRIGDKFGADVLESLRAVTQRKFDDAGVELDASQRRQDYLSRLSSATNAGLWVCAAERLHNGASILADLRRTLDPESVWSRIPAGKEPTIHSFRRVTDRLREVGFTAPIMDELEAVIVELEEWGRKE